MKDKLKEVEEIQSGMRKTLNTPPNDPKLKVPWLERGLFELRDRIQKTSQKLQDTREQVRVLEKQCHDEIVRLISEDPDRPDILHDSNLEEKFEDAKEEAENLALILEGLEAKRTRLEDELTKAKDELMQVQAGILASKVPGLITEYDRAMKTAFNAASVFKTIRGSELFWRLDADTKAAIVVLAFETANHFPTGEIKSKHLITLRIPDLTPKDKQKIIENLLK